LCRSPEGATGPRLSIASARLVRRWRCAGGAPVADDHLLAAVVGHVAHASPANHNFDPAAPIARRERLGILSYYYRPAA
jgi:hypothetical protein